MSTAADIIRRAMKKLGVLASGETPSSDEQADALTDLNAMLAGWANERLLIYGTRRSTFTLTPNLSPHTIGATGTFVAQRPVRLEGAGVTLVGTDTELPLNVLTDTQYQYIVNKDLTSDFPLRVWMEQTYPNANLWFWPVPTTPAALALYTWSQITSFAAGDTVSLPTGYEDALVHALAIKIAPDYSVQPSPTLLQNTLDAVASIKRANAPDVASELDPAILGRRTFNIHTG